MDRQTFDTVTRLFGTAGSRRTAMRTLLTGALLGVTARSAAAARCPNRKHLCGGACCPGKCFTNEFCEVCCTERNIVCPTAEGSVCCLNEGDPCAFVRARGACPPAATPVGAVSASGESCASGIAGSYRRR
jgi:hypothetical protein